MLGTEVVCKGRGSLAEHAGLLPPGVCVVL